MPTSEKARSNSRAKSLYSTPTNLVTTSESTQTDSVIRRGSFHLPKLKRPASIADKNWKHTDDQLLYNFVNYTVQVKLLSYFHKQCIFFTLKLNSSGLWIGLIFGSKFSSTSLTHSYHWSLSIPPENIS